jgi:hypothetical protein
MKLSHFLVLAVLVAGGGIFGLAQACKSGDVPAPTGDTARSAPSPRPKPPTPTPTPTPTPSNDPSDSTSTPGTATPSGNSDLAARSYDAEVIAWSKRSIGGDKMKDATKGKSWKLNLYKDAGFSTVNRAKVDIDRDDKFDEKYTFETTKITLQCAPNDDESYTETYHWNGIGWTKE